MNFKTSTIFHVALAIAFFTSGLIINFIQFVLFYTLRYYDKNLFRKINYYLDYSIYSQMVFLGEWWSGSEIVFYADKAEFDEYFGKEHGLLVMNHSYETDWVLGWIILERLGILGNAKAYCKKAIQYLPVLGWAWSFSEYVFLERDYKKDKEAIFRQVSELASYEEPMWLLLYPEGTRFTEEKHKASIEFARKTNQPELKYHLLPRTKGFIATLPAMKGKVHAIYDTLTVFKENEPVEPTIKNLLMGKSVTQHSFFRRIPLDQIPDTEEGQDQFLKDLFATKDKMKEGFLKHGDFFKLTGDSVKRVEPIALERRLYSLLNVVCWLFLVIIPMIWYLLKALFGGQIIVFSIGASIIGAFYYMLNQLLKVSDIKSSSSYGTNGKKLK